MLLLEPNKLGPCVETAFAFFGMYWRSKAEESTLTLETESDKEAAFRAYF